MPVVCHPRPNRKTARTFKARDVGRIACAAIADGEDPAEVVLRVSACIPKLQELLEKVEELREKVIEPLETARNAIATVKEIVDDVDNVLTKLSKLPIIGPIINRFVSVRLRIAIKAARAPLEKVLTVLDNVIELLNALHI